MASGDGGLHSVLIFGALVLHLFLILRCEPAQQFRMVNTKYIEIIGQSIRSW